MLFACGGGGGSSSPTPSTPAPQPTNQAPTASFTISAESGNAPLTVTVDASGSGDTDGDIAAFAWDFAGTSGIGTTAQHTFTAAGTFEVRLTVTDDDGASATATRAVEVTDSVATASVSGTVQILSSTAIDRDVHDRLTIASPNDTFDEAQPIPSAVTLGGFANVAGEGVSTGNLFTDGDPGDFFQVSFVGNETITLSIAESGTDLDLRLWDEGRNLVDASLGLAGVTETLEVDTPGNYFVEVFPFAGASNYVLNIGTRNTANALHVTSRRAPTRLSDPFVPGEVILHGSSDDLLDLMSDVNLEPRSIAPGPALGALPNLESRPRTALHLPDDGRVHPSLAARYQTLLVIKALCARDDVQYAEPNVIVHAHAAPNDTFYGSQWHYPAINLPVAWDVTTGDETVVVAVVDTGVLLAHPDLDERLVPGYDFVRNAERARDGDGIDSNPDDPGDLEFGGSSSFHGTHVAGTIGAETDNRAGAAGVTWATRIMPIRALGRDGGTTFDVIQGVRWAAGLSNDSGTLPAEPADIINLSLGSTFSSQGEQDTYNAVRQAGILLIASAGNESSSLPTYPAAYDGVIGVSATTITNAIASYSNFGSYVDVAAPGGSGITDLNGDGIGDGVISTIGDDGGETGVQFGYAQLSGTSMAAPHVAGVAALMRAVHPSLTPAEFEAALVAGDLTDDLGAAGRDDRYGYGLINAQKAVFAAEQLASGQGTDPGPVLTASSSTLNFGAFTTSIDTTLQNVGTGSVNITSATSSESWLTVNDPGTPDGLGGYRLIVDRNGLADGAYQAVVTFTSDANDVTVTVIMQVTSVDLTANAGLHYILLVDNDGETAVPAIIVTADQGEYTFTVDDVPYGQYRLFAGTDSDDDELLCDAGEACGAYPTLDSPAVINVNSDLTSLEFVSGFRVNLTSASANQTGSTNSPPTQKIDKPANKPNER
jgi:serine protease